MCDKKTLLNRLNTYTYLAYTHIHANSLVMERELKHNTGNTNSADQKSTAPSITAFFQSDKGYLIYQITRPSLIHMSEKKLNVS